MNSKRAITAVTGDLMIISFGAFANRQSILGTEGTDKDSTKTPFSKMGQKFGLR